MSQFHFSNARLRSGWSYQSFNDLMWALAVCLLLMQGISQAGDLPTYKPAVRLDSPEMKDQDDMCVWVHPTAPEKSSVICSDKSANALFVYDLEGTANQLTWWFSISAMVSSCAFTESMANHANWSGLMTIS
jgi:hypothetical protein